MALLLEAHDPLAQLLVVDKKGRSALMIAACEGHTSCVNLLLSVPAARWEQQAISYAGLQALMKAVMQQDRNGITALMLACSRGHTDAVDLLLDAFGGDFADRYCQLRNK